MSTFPSCLIHLSKRTKIHTPPCILRRFGQAAFSTRFAQGGSDTHQPHHASILRHRAPGRHRADDTVHSRFGRAAFSSPSCLIHPPLWVADDKIPKRTKIYTPPRILRRFGQSAFSTRFAQGGSDTHQPHHASILRHHAPGRHRADDTAQKRRRRRSNKWKT